jgi:hypothetical protein
MQRVEISDAIHAEDHGLAIDDELLAPAPQRGLGDPWKPPGPVMAAAGNQADPVALALDPEAVPVILDFVEPLSPDRYDRADGGNAELELGHGSEIGGRRRFWSRAA